MLRFIVLTFAFLFSASTFADEFASRYQAITDSKGKASDTDRLHALFTVDWAYNYSAFPEYSTFLGIPGFDTKWTDLSPEAIAERRSFATRPLDVLLTIDRAQLSLEDQLNYDLFKRGNDEGIEGLRFPLEYLQISQLDGIQQDAANLFEVMPKQTVVQFENQIARLKALPTRIDQTIALLSKGLKSGFTPPQITLRGVAQQVKNQIPDAPLESPLLIAFKEMPKSMSADDAKRLRDAATKLYVDSVKPAFERLEQFIRNEYEPKARTTIGANKMPDGEAYYAWKIKTTTSTNLSAKEIHKIGLAEVKRLAVEMEKVKNQAGFKGTMAEFVHYLQTDPKFFFTDKEQLLMAYRDIAKRADPELMKIIKTLPRSTYGVRPVPKYSEKEQTTAYYQEGAPEAGRPGYFYANTYALGSRPKWEMQPLTLHEAVPGHHIQLSLAKELRDLPDFRRYGGYTAFVEGWGLYSETLGYEMGFYTDPYDKFGQLSYEIWRAGRLVVDTGMHELGWSRQQAIDYLKANTSKPEHDIIVEIDRYIVWPGQALAYKLGQMKIREMRNYAEKQLGGKFDERLFHDAVLRDGAVPLSVLEANIRAWVTSIQSAQKS